MSGVQNAEAMEGSLKFVVQVTGYGHLFNFINSFTSGFLIKRDGRMFPPLFERMFLEEYGKHAVFLYDRVVDDKV